MFFTQMKLGFTCRVMLMPKTTKFGMTLIPTSFEKPEYFHRKLERGLQLATQEFIGPICFTAAINSAAYCDIDEQFISQLQVNERYCYLPQDGAMAHTVRNTIGPICFTATINSAAYCDIDEQFISQLQVFEKYCYLPQDGAMAHTVRNTMTCLHEFFYDRLNFPPDEVFNTLPNNLDQVK